MISIQFLHVDHLGSPVAATTPDSAQFTDVDINFQTAAAPLPAGFEKDDCSVYADRGNGYTYRWDFVNTVNARDRNNASAPDQQHDTLNHVQFGTNASW